ncbi:hypothetical protein E2C01_049705 [Portunus trituberculatus]|uniref:Uncharacterized protein n=1 Tax=Portunus trituberculatus TaxID=210409 RepID=A0A5B7G6B5_PORTR|nr:hypothetical protein [Portunus trituberculatus]
MERKLAKTTIKQVQDSMQELDQEVKEVISLGRYSEGGRDTSESENEIPSGRGGNYDHTERRKASFSDKRKSSPSSQQLHKCMEKTLAQLSLFLSSSQGSPFSGFQSPASQVDDSQLGMSGAMQRPG